MASPLTQRALQSIADTGFTRAQKLADLSIKINTDSSGGATKRGYEQAIGYLQPYIDSGKKNEAIDAQRAIAGYNNSLDKLNSKERDQNETVAAFKLQEYDSYFTSFDGDTGGFRDPSSLIGTTSDSLDSLVLGVINAIDDKQAKGDSTDQLYGYLNDLNKRADIMRDLRNRFEKGQLTGQTLDGFGYYVDTNPLDGSVRAAALIPAGIAPADVTKGFHRLEATTNVGGALLPVYAPAQQNALGEYTARVGDATWNGTGQGTLQASNASQSKNLFQEGGFSISDGAVFPVRSSSLDKGAFGRGFIGRDSNGNPVESIFYRGVDNKLYSVDQATLDSFQKDPQLSKKLDGYVTQFSPTETKNLMKDATPFAPDRIGRESKISGLQTQADAAQAEADRMQGMGFFEKLKSGFTAPSSQTPAIPEEPKASFFDNKNNPTKPQEPTISNSAPDIVEQGKSFFRKGLESLNVKLR